MYWKVDLHFSSWHPVLLPPLLFFPAMATNLFFFLGTTRGFFTDTLSDKDGELNSLQL